MSRKTSAYIKRRRALGGVNPAIAKARGIASLLATLRLHRAYSDDSAMPGDVYGADDLMVTARKAMLYLHSALDGLLNCQPPEDPHLDFSRIKHALSVAAIRTLQMVYGNKRRDPLEKIDMSVLNPDQAHAIQLIYDANQALNRAYDRWEAGKGYGLDGEGRGKLIEAAELYEVILINSTPEQMAHAHSEALKIRAKCEVAA